MMVHRIEQAQGADKIHCGFYFGAIDVHLERLVVKDKAITMSISK